MSHQSGYRSFAEWPADTFTAEDGSHVSTDDHHTEEEAQSVCRMLLRHGFGGNGPRPVRVWVEVFPPNASDHRACAQKGQE